MSRFRRRNSLSLPLVNASVLAVLAAATGTHCALAASDERVEFFESRVRPLLIERCYECHSAKAAKVKGGLMVDSREQLLKGGDSGPAIVPGHPEKSLLIKAVHYADKDLQMPPKHQ